MPQLQDLGLNILAILRCPYGPWLGSCASIRIHAAVSVPGGRGGGISPTAAAQVHSQGTRVKATCFGVVRRPGLCFLAGMLLCPGITVCEAFVSKLGVCSSDVCFTQRWRDLSAIIPRLALESLGSVTAAVFHESVRVARGVWQPQRAELSCRPVGGLLSPAPRHQGAVWGHGRRLSYSVVGRKQRKFDLQELRTLYSVTSVRSYF